MTTERLHYDDPLRLTLTSRVVALATHDDRASVILDRTVFYPESGGQLGDRGRLGSADVIDAQLDADEVHHVFVGEPPAVGDEVEVQVDAMRRRSHMALHSGQHALSRALLDHCGAVTVSSRLGKSACTLDVDVAGLTLETLRPVEDAVNRLIDEDRPVTQRFVAEQELSALLLRKPPPEKERVRVVDIDGFDVTPCGGTHVVSTAQIELLTLSNVERYKGGTRITFEAGPRARALLTQSDRRLREVASSLKCAPPEVAELVSGLKDKLRAARDGAGTLRAQLAERWAASLPITDGSVIATVDGADPALLKVIAERLVERVPLVALAASTDGGVHALIACAEGSDRSAGTLLKHVASATGGRGGGRPHLAQGRLPVGADFERAVRDAL